MTTQDFHTLVEQDVQKISSFAYEDMLPEEVDIQANKAFYKWLDTFADLRPRGSRMDDTEARLNDIRTLVKRDAPLSLVSNGNVSVASLPDNYLYLVGIKLRTYYECSTRPQSSLQPNKVYVVKSASIIYEGHTYFKGDVVYPTSILILGKSDVVYQLSTYDTYGRIVRNEDVDRLNDTYYGVTNYRSPIVSVSETGINVSTLNKFFVDPSSLATYIRQPRVINSANPSELIDLPINGAYKLAALTVSEILEVTEQPQQKIENLKN